MAIESNPLREVLREELKEEGHRLKEYDLTIYTRLVEKYKPTHIEIQEQELGSKLFKGSNGAITWWKQFPADHSMADKIERHTKPVESMLSQVDKTSAL